MDGVICDHKIYFRIVPMSNISAYDCCSVSTWTTKCESYIGEEKCHFYAYENPSILNRYDGW